MSALSDYQKDDRVRLLGGVRHKHLCGQEATVKKTVKRTNMVWICDNGEEYGAFPQNVEKI